MTLLEAHVQEELAPLLEEVGSKNHVRVGVSRLAPKARTWRWRPVELVSDSRTDDAEVRALLPQLTQLDSLRMLKGLKPYWLAEAMRRTGGELRSVTFNLRPTVGADYCASALGDAGSRAAVAQYIALSNNIGTLDAADTASRTTSAAGPTGITWGNTNVGTGAGTSTSGEYTGLGLSRSSATYAHPTNTSITQTHQFTATNTATGVVVCGLFNSATQGQGSLFVENNFTSTNLANGDAITIAWTINL